MSISIGGEKPRDRLIVALDVPTVSQAEGIVKELSDSVTFYKIGYQLVFAGGLELARRLVDTGKRVFLDMKLHDIDHTVARGVENIARMGVTFLTVSSIFRALSLSGISSTISLASRVPSVMPGHTQLDVMLERPYSRAMVFVKAITPPCAAE